MDEIQKTLLAEVADLHGVPAGAYNIRSNGESIDRKSTEHIEIVGKTDKSGIDIYIKPGTKNESVHIPVILSQTGLKELVYNDFHIGEDCDVDDHCRCGIPITVLMQPVNMMVFIPFSFGKNAKAALCGEALRKW